MAALEIRNTGKNPHYIREVRKGSLLTTPEGVLCGSGHWLTHWKLKAPPASWVRAQNAIQFVIKRTFVLFVGFSRNIANLCFLLQLFFLSSGGVDLIYPLSLIFSENTWKVSAFL